MNTENRFKQIAERMRRFSEERNWAQFHDPKNLAISLNLEASEVLELFQWTKDNKEKSGLTDEMADELADVLYWLIMLSNHYDIDLLEALNKKMDKNEEKYPVEEAKGKSTKYNEL